MITISLPLTATESSPVNKSFLFSPKRGETCLLTCNTNPLVFFIENNIGGNGRGLNREEQHDLTTNPAKIIRSHLFFQKILEFGKVVGIHVKNCNGGGGG